MTTKFIMGLVGERYGNDSNFRISVDDKIRYVEIDKNIYDHETLSLCWLDPETFFSRLPSFPGGDWNIGKISKTEGTNQPQLYVKKEELFSMAQWHTVSIDVRDMKLTDQTFTRQVLNPSDLGLKTPALIKWAPYEYIRSYLEPESLVYRKFYEDEDLKDLRAHIPPFLGHVNEHGSVIGFILEELQGVRHAGPDDLQACRETLGLFHAKGFLHGDICRYNILIRKDDGFVVLIDFATTKQVTDASLLEEEMAKLEPALNSKSEIGYHFLLDR